MGSGNLGRCEIRSAVSVYGLAGSGKVLSGNLGRGEASFGVEYSGVLRMGTIRSSKVR